MNDTYRAVIGLIECALTGRSDIVIAESTNWAFIFELGQHHHILPLLYTGIRKVKKPVPEDILREMKAALYTSVLIEDIQLSTLHGVFAEFEAESIDYLPVKGVELKALYPESSLRPMGDADILIRTEQYDSIIPIMLRLGFKQIKESDHEYIWDKDGALTIELHKTLVSSRNVKFAQYYMNIWEKALPNTGGTHKYCLTDEDVFIFLFVHFSKHYRATGIGIQHLIDIEVYQRAHPDLDRTYVVSELNKLGLHIFFEHIEETLQVWFENRESNEIVETITNWIFESGSFGNDINEKKSSVIRAIPKGNYRQAKIRYVLYHLFPDISRMKAKYAILHRLPIILPFMWGYRISRFLLQKKGQVNNEVNALRTLSSKELLEYRLKLDLVGLPIEEDPLKSDF